MGLTQNLTPKQIRFLKCFEACASVTQAARWAKIQRETHYAWKRESKEYCGAFEQSEQIAARTLEDEAVRRAHQGVKKAIRYKGKIVGYDHEYSDSLMAVLLKGCMPEKYRERSITEVTGKDGSPLGADLAKLREVLMPVMASLPPEVRARVSRELLAADGLPH